MNNDTEASTTAQPAVAGPVHQPVRRLPIPLYNFDKQAPGMFKSSSPTAAWAKTTDVKEMVRQHDEMAADLAALWPDVRQLVDGFVANGAWNNDWDESVRKRMIAFGLRYLA